MRTELQKIGSKERHTFTGTFERYGTKSGYKGYPEPTLLLLEIKDTEGNLLTDHQWFNLTVGFACLDLQKGDVVQFDGRIQIYERGYQGRRSDVYAPVSIDYKIARPTKIIKIEEQ